MEDEIVLKKIGEKLKELRIKAGYSSHENFAYETGLSRAYYWKIESGKANITIIKLVQLLNVHNITFEEFFKGM